MKASGNSANDTAMEAIPAPNMILKENLLMENEMVKASLALKTVMFMKDFMKTAECTVRVSILLPVVRE